MTQPIRKRKEKQTNWKLATTTHKKTIKQAQNNNNKSQSANTVNVFQKQICYVNKLFNVALQGIQLERGIL